MACDPHVLKHVPLFALLDDDEACVLAGQVELKEFAARQRIYKIGDSGGQAYVMVSGKVRITTIDEDHQEVMVDEPQHGEFFGFASMLEQTPHQTNAVALEPSVCLEVDRHDIAVNARDAMPKGGILKLETRNVEIQEDEREARSNLKAGPYVELIVTDTGIGMDISVQAHIFEPFYTTKPIGKGTGLGLSTVYGIVQQAQGATVFSSQPGAGSTFRVFLPRIDSSPSLKKTDAPTDISMTGTETILLVEDDHSVCELVRSVLSSHGYAVLFSSRPQEAEALCDSHNGKIDLLLTDVVMPEMSGAELSKRILGKKPSIKVLFMSGYIDDSIVRAGVEENEVAFLQKPFSPHGLAQKVRAVLDAAPARKLV